MNKNVLYLNQLKYIYHFCRRYFLKRQKKNEIASKFQPFLLLIDKIYCSLNIFAAMIIQSVVISIQIHLITYFVYLRFYKKPPHLQNVSRRITKFIHLLFNFFLYLPFQYIEQLTFLSTNYKYLNLFFVKTMQKMMDLITKIIDFQS